MEPQPEPTVAPSALSFADTAIAFEYKSDTELRRSHLLFRSIQSNTLVAIGPHLVTWALKVGLPIQGLLKTYFFNQFCGGVTIADTAPTAQTLFRYGVTSILDYGVEGAKNDKSFDETTEELLRVVRQSEARPELSFTAMKMTGIGSFELMEKKQRGDTLAAFELEKYQKMKARLVSICEEAAAKGQSVLLDAEESWIQEEIDRLAEEMMVRFNQTAPVLYTTIQLYRHDRLVYLKQLIERSQAEGWILAVKLVRGAYLEKENKRAEDMGYPTPMQPNKAATDRDFDLATELCLQHLTHVAMLAGTHNENSCRLLAERMHQMGIPHNHPWVHFGQLYGMSDNLSFNLAKSGYNAAKYLPYGPLKAVLPYLFRRANENTSIAGQTGRELVLIEQELHRRRRQKRLRA